VAIVIFFRIIYMITTESHIYDQEFIITFSFHFFLQIYLRKYLNFQKNWKFLLKNRKLRKKSKFIRYLKFSETVSEQSF
jgi:hypothetical protein